MKHRIVSTKDAPQRLEERYLPLKAHLNDLDGFYKFIMVRLRQFRLNGRYGPDDIINECILRWYKAVEAGKPIPVLDGWMRLTAHNVVRELSRKNQKVHLYEPTVLAELIPEDLKETEQDNEQHSIVNQALQTLREDKRELLQLRFVHTLSWEAIAEVYITRGEKVSVSTLRKRGQRNVEELRKAFLKILQDI